MATIDIAAAQEFLYRFDYTKLTLAAIREQGAPNKSFKLDHFLSTKNAVSGKAKISASIDPLLLNDENFLAELVALQKIKRAIYFLVNESDGEAKQESGNTNLRQNIIKLNACFADTDLCPVQDFIQWLKMKGVAPHIVVETSPKKFHFYFLLQPTDLAHERKWKAVQQCMEWMGDPTRDTGMDKTMHDVTQLMRVPGFFHQKTKPFQIRIVKQNYHNAFFLDDLFDRLGAESFYFRTEDRKTYEYPKRKISSGERHEALRNYALSVANDFRTDVNALAKTIDAVDGFMLKNFEAPHAFLQGGNRRAEVERTIGDAVNKVQKEILDVLPLAAFDESDASEKDPFALPPTFFYDCPGIVGEITKSICLKAKYPAPSITWASVVTLMGTLKASYLTSELGHAPSNYFLCLAGSGAGKNYPQEVLAHTLNTLGIPELTSNKVRSARGIELLLRRNNNCASLIIDESEDFLQGFIDDKAPQHLRACKALLLEMYSKTNTPYYHSGFVGNTKDVPIVLNYPRLSLITHGAPHTLERSFNLKAIADGLLQRFIILTHKDDRKANKAAIPAASLNGTFISSLQEMVVESKIITLETVQRLQDLRAELDNEDDRETKKRIAEEIDAITKMANTAEKKKLHFEPAAKKKLLAFSDKLDLLYNKEVRCGNGLEGLYTRGAEQVGRLATAISEGPVSPALIDYLATLIESRIEAVKYLAETRIFDSAYLRDKKGILAKIIKHYRKNGEPVSYRWLSQPCSHHRKHLRELLDGLYDDGSLIMITPPSAGGRGKKGETFAPAAPEVDTPIL